MNGLIRWRRRTLRRLKSTSCGCVGCHPLRCVKPVIISCYMFSTQSAQILNDENTVVSGGINLLCKHLFQVTPSDFKAEEVVVSIPYQLILMPFVSVNEMN